MEIKRRISRIAFYTLVAFYFFAGVNHFLNPTWYYPLIPDYLGYPEFFNAFAGIAEIIGALGLIFNKTKKIASLCLIGLLLAFVPAHWYFIQMDSCIENSLCIAPWVAWLRLVIVHPLLIWLLLWAKNIQHGID